MIVDVGAAEEFVPGKARVFRISGREVLVLKWRDEWFGLRNVCPHQTETLAKGA